MKRVPILAAVVFLTAVATNATALDRTPQDKGNGLSSCEERYLGLYEKAHKADLDVGRNLVQWGLNTAHGVEPITDARACSEADQLEAALNPPKPEPAPTVEAAPAPASAPVETASSGGCPSYMAAEATSPDAVNPTSGASGCYQVLPSTAAAMGAACDDVNSTSCVDAICASQGNGAWASSGATPCG